MTSPKPKPENQVIRIYIWLIRFVAFLGIVFLLVGLVATFLNYRFMQNAIATSGTVLHVQIDSSGENPTYRPIIMFDDANGNSQVASTYMASNRYNFEKGQKLDVLYTLDDLETVKINSWFGRWGLGVMFIIAGVFFTGIALFASKMVQGGQVANLFGLIGKAIDRD